MRSHLVAPSNVKATVDCFAKLFPSSAMAPLAPPEVSDALCVDVTVVKEKSTGLAHYVLKRMQRFADAFEQEMGKMGICAGVLTFEGAGLVKGMGGAEIRKIKDRVRQERPDMLVVNLGFNDHGIKAEDARGMSRLRDAVASFLAIGVAETVFVVPDDSDKDEVYGHKGSVIRSVHETLRDARARTTILSYSAAEPSSSQALQSVHVDNFHFTAVGQRELVPRHARHLANLGCQGKMLVVTDSTWTSHDYRKVKFDAAEGIDVRNLDVRDLDRFGQARWKHPLYSSSFTMRQLLRSASHRLGNLDEIVDKAFGWRRESQRATPTVDGFSFAEQIQESNIFNGIGPAAATKACRLWSHKLRFGPGAKEMIGKPCVVAIGGPLAKLLATFDHSIRTRLVMMALLRCRIPW